MGITGKVGGATAEHLLAHGKEVRALVRNREKGSSWANQGVELVDGDWNDSAAIERALKGVEGAFVMLPAVWAPSPDYKEAKGVIANYVEALTLAAEKYLDGLLGDAGLTREPVNHLHRVAGIVDEQLLAGDMDLAQGRLEAAGPLLVAFAEP
nr:MULTISPECIES: NmrA family NAD(P)-binding protein [unclassified Bradyrhizobium]